ncbi:MAG: translation initiation factor IF-2 N-terminal domain-containing protein, partial [Candidatus Hinthialibacter sp.]
MRINQIARKYGLENKAIIDYLDSIGVHGKSHSSSLDDGTIELLLQHFGKLEPKESEKPEKSVRRFAKIRRPKSWKPSKKEETPAAAPVETAAKGQHVQPGTSAPEPAQPAAIAPAETPIEAAPVESVLPETEKPQESIQASASVEPPAEAAAVEVVPEDETQAPPVEETQAQKAEAASPPPKKEEPKKAKRAKDKRPEKRAKTKAIPLGAIKEHKGEPEIIIEAPELDLTALEDKPAAVVDIE